MRAGSTRLSTRSNTRPAAAAGSTPGTAMREGRAGRVKAAPRRRCTAARRPCRQQTSRRGRAQSRRCGSLPTGDAAMRRWQAERAKAMEMKIARSSSRTGTHRKRLAAASGTRKVPRKSNTTTQREETGRERRTGKVRRRGAAAQCESR
ncbi:hypothetical protein IQ07DRAFT_634277 [Pyrenochaeta sp. DS3sAY3a]|nr:hypothetical protein IQ07DRAFT_634277 [Pyrenochaeta sp. DS3sAY3a]